ncbi:MAG: hypothetical protein GC159_12265 [Phycisphaera sp.]|nr:hypothetical protein [Phycisphaera sp.]
MGHRMWKRFVIVAACGALLSLPTLRASEHVTIAEASAASSDKAAPDTTPTWPEAQRQRNAEMKRRVDAWLADGTDSRMPVYVVYLTCSDQEPFAGYRERQNRVLSEVQEWFAKQTDAAGFGRVTMNLERDADGLVKLHMGKLPFDLASRTKENNGETHRACESIAKSLLSEVGVDFNRSFVLMLTTIPDDHGAAPFYGVILQNRGVCFAVDAPWVDSAYTQTDGPKVWKGKRAGPANSALIGGIAHEMGHGLGLPHSDEPAAEKSFGESLMASGNYSWREEARGKGCGTYLLDTDAMLLISRPPFTGRVRDFDKQPRAKFEDVRFETLADGRVRVTGRVASDIPAYAVKVYDDPPNNDDYNSIAYAALPDEKTGAFEIAFAPIRSAGDHELRLVAYHVNGRWTQKRTSITVDGDGKADVTNTSIYRK